MTNCFAHQTHLLAKIPQPTGSGDEDITTPRQQSPLLLHAQPTDNTDDADQGRLLCPYGQRLLLALLCLALRRAFRRGSRFFRDFLLLLLPLTGSEDLLHMLVHLQRQFSSRTQDERAEYPPRLGAACEFLLSRSPSRVGREEPIEHGEGVGEGFAGTLGQAPSAVSGGWI